MRKPILKLTTLAAGLALMMACGGGQDGSADTSGDPPDVATGEGRAGTIRFGAALSETGKFAVEGRDSRQGYDTWVTWVNEEYGGIQIDGRRFAVEIVYYDDESDADTPPTSFGNSSTRTMSTSCWAPTRAASPPARAP